MKTVTTPNGGDDTDTGPTGPWAKPLTTAGSDPAPEPNLPSDVVRARDLTPVGLPPKPPVPVKTPRILVPLMPPPTAPPPVQHQAVELARPIVTAFDANWHSKAPIRVHPPDARRRKEPRQAGFALSMLVLLSLLATFFAWVTAEPMWLAFGHADRGTATITNCTGTGVSQRCVGAFTASDGAFTVDRVAMLGVAEDERHAGSAVTARMVAAHRCGDTRVNCRAYAASHPGLHLRWITGLLLIVLCGLGIAWATGAFRLERGRMAAVVASVGGPLLLAFGFLVAAW